jgi:hypothetical protein
VNVELVANRKSFKESEGQLTEAKRQASELQIKLVELQSKHQDVLVTLNEMKTQELGLKQSHAQEKSKLESLINELRAS